jgi:hypothetical protein
MLIEDCKSAPGMVLGFLSFILVQHCSVARARGVIVGFRVRAGTIPIMVPDSVTASSNRADGTASMRCAAIYRTSPRPVIDNFLTVSTFDGIA